MLIARRMSCVQAMSQCYYSYAVHGGLRRGALSGGPFVAEPPQAGQDLLRSHFDIEGGLDSLTVRRAVASRKAHLSCQGSSARLSADVSVRQTPQNEHSLLQSQHAALQIASHHNMLLCRSLLSRPRHPHLCVPEPTNALARYNGPAPAVMSTDESTCMCFREPGQSAACRSSSRICCLMMLPTAQGW